MPLLVREASLASGYVCPPPIVFEDRTGEPGPSSELLSLDAQLALSGGSGGPNDPGQAVALVGALLGGLDPQGAITASRSVFIIDTAARPQFIASGGPDLALIMAPARSTSMVPQVRSGFVRGRSRVPGSITPAEELRTITGLAPARLAELFSISRTAFYKWIDGATPRDARFQHLLDVLAHVRDATRKLPATFDLAAWLQTPVAPGGHCPLDYLREQRFSTFRGLLVRARSADMDLSAVSSAFPITAATRAARALARERISPRPRIDEDDENRDPSPKDHGT